MIETERSPVLVRGVGDVGSVVAAVLFHAGYAVALHDDPAPAAPRRGMAFVDAVFDGMAMLDGLTVLRVGTSAELRDALAAHEVVPVTVVPLFHTLDAANWSAVIDARMRKRAAPERQREMAPLTIGLGPNFVASETVDLAIETMWSDRLSAVIEAGATLPLAGEPRAIGGVERARFVYAPASCRFETNARIGDRVEEGAVIATIGEIGLRAPIGGVLRGLTRSGVEVPIRTKLSRSIRAARRRRRSVWESGRAVSRKVCSRRSQRRACSNRRDKHLLGVILITAALKAFWRRGH